MIIEPTEIRMTYRTGGLKNLTRNNIVDILGLKPNADDDPDKVVFSWQFTLDGHPCAIWDYKGSHMARLWSFYDPDNVLHLIFKKEHFQ